MIDLKSLNENLTKLQEDFTNAIHEKELLEKTISDLKNSQQSQISELNSRKDPLNVLLTQLNENKESTQNTVTIDRYNQEIKSIEQQIADIDSSIATAKSSHDETNKNNAKRLETLNKRISVMFDSYNHLVETSKTEIATEIQSLNEQYNAIKSATPQALEALTILLEQLDAQRAQIENQSYDLEQKKNDLEARKNIPEYIDYVDEWNNEIEQIDKQLMALSEQATEIDNTILSNKQEAFPQLKALNKDLDALKAQKSLLENQTPSIEDQIKELNENKEQLIRNNPDIDSYYLESIDLQISELQQQLPAIENAISQKEDEIANLFSITPAEISDINSKTVDSIEKQIDQLLAMDKVLNPINIEKSDTLASENNKKTITKAKSTGKRTKRKNKDAKKGKSQEQLSSKSATNEALLSKSISAILASINKIDPSISIESPDISGNDQEHDVTSDTDADKKIIAEKEKEEKKNRLEDAMSKARAGIKDYNSKRKKYEEVQNNIFNSLQAISDIINPEIGNDLKNYDEFNKILNISVLKPYLDDYLKRLGQSLNEDNPIIDNWQNLTLIFPSSDTLRIGNIDKALKDIQEFSAEINNILEQISKKATSPEIEKINSDVPETTMEGETSENFFKKLDEYNKLVDFLWNNGFPFSHDEFEKLINTPEIRTYTPFSKDESITPSQLLSYFAHPTGSDLDMNLSNLKGVIDKLNEFSKEKQMNLNTIYKPNEGHSEQQNSDENKKQYNSGIRDEMEEEYGDENEYVDEKDYQEKKPSIWSRIWAKITRNKPLQIESAEAKAAREENISSSQSSYRTRREAFLNSQHNEVKPIDYENLNTNAGKNEHEEVLEGNELNQ